MNRLLKQTVVCVIVSCALISQSGCKSETDKMLSKGVEKFEKADYAGAAKIYEEIIKKDSTNVEAYFKLASANACIHKNMKMFEMEWRRAMNMNSPKLHNNKLNAGEKRKTVYDDSLPSSNEISAFTDAIKKNPKCAELYFGRGLSYFNQHNRDGCNAIIDFTSAIALDKNFAAAYLMRARTYFYYIGARELPNESIRKKYNAVFDFKRALNADSKNTETLHELGNAYMMAGRHKAAIDYLDRLLLIDRENYHAISLRAFCKTMIGDYSVAIKDYDILVSKFPHEAVYLKDRGFQKIMSGQHEDGLSDLRKAKTLSKDKWLRNEIQSALDKYSSGKK